jgi:hypothetical protein
LIFSFQKTHGHLQNIRTSRNLHDTFQANCSDLPASKGFYYSKSLSALQNTFISPGLDIFHAKYSIGKKKRAKKKTRDFFKTVLGLQFFTNTDEILYNEPLLCIL